MLTCLLLFQCTAPQPVPVLSAFQGAPAAIRVDPQFHAGLNRLTSGQPWSGASPSAELDWLLVGVRAKWNDLERVWFVRVVEVLDPEEAEGGRRLQDRRFEYTVPFGVGMIKPDAKFAVRCRRIRVETYDDKGEFIATWSRLVPEVFPDASMFEALATLPQTRWFNGEDSVGGDWDRASLGAVSDDRARNAIDLLDPQRLRDCGLYEMVATLQALGTTPPVAPIRDVVKDHIVQTPSLLAILLAGLKPTATATMRVATQGEFPWVLDRMRVPCYEAEFETFLEGERCFDCRLVAGPSVPPFNLLGGLLVIEAVHPQRPDNRLTVRVLASSRATPAVE